MPLTKSMTDLPVLWSFRRCPYAIRARMALLSAGRTVELREIKLSDKPRQFLDVSPSATVPTLEADGKTLDESLEIMSWALRQNDPEELLNVSNEGWRLIEQNDGPFKQALDHTKYAVRYPDLDPLSERRKASEFLRDLDARLARHPCLMGRARTLVDVAVFPFVRQFAHIDRDWFNTQPWPNLIVWLDCFLDSEVFHKAMVKAPVWKEGAGAPVLFRN